jgi:hypothetical protein
LGNRGCCDTFWSRKVGRVSVGNWKWDGDCEHALGGEAAVDRLQRQKPTQGRAIMSSSFLRRRGPCHATRAGEARRSNFSLATQVPNTKALCSCWPLCALSLSSMCEVRTPTLQIGLTCHVYTVISVLRYVYMYVATPAAVAAIG